MKTFKGRTAVITGGASGFGREFARIAQRLGMNIVIVDVQQDALDTTKGEIKASGGSVLAMKADVSNADQLQAVADTTLKRFGVPSLVFNNAGVAHRIE